MTIPIDPRIVDSITITPGPRPGWALKEILYFLDNEQDPTGTFQAQQAVMWAWAREPGQKIGHGVAGQRFRYCFPTFTPSGKPPNGDEDKRDTDQRGLCNFGMTGNSWDVPTDKGVYFIHPVAKGQVTGDIVGGMGIRPAHHHADYVLCYEYEVEQPPEPPPPDTEPDFWSAVRAVSNQIPEARFISMPWQGHTYQLSRYAGGGVIAVEVERPGMIFLMTATEVLKGN